MKICHVTSSHPRYDGRIFQKECTSLAKKYDVVLLCSDIKKDEIKNNVYIHSIGIDSKTKLNRFIIIPKKLKKECISINADVYHFHDPELIKLAFVMKKKGKKVVYDSHEDNVNRIANRTWIPNFLKPLVKKYYCRLESKIVSRIDAVITVTNHIYDRLVKYNSNTTIITNYPIIDNNRISQLKNAKTLCFAGGVDRQYMHHNIIKSLKDLNVKYKIAGPISDDYRKELKELDEYKKVDLLGVLSKEKVNQLYLQSGIGMVLIDYIPNIDYKHGSMGITKVFEYMAYGLPIIATDLDVWLEFVPNNCGICVNPNSIDEIHDAIKYLIDHPKEAKKMGENGRKLVEHKYNWKTQETILYKIYQDLKQ